MVASSSSIDPSLFIIDADVRAIEFIRLNIKVELNEGEGGVTIDYVHI
jgi:hypothetical protein